MAGKKVVRYKRKPKAAALIFAVIFIYLICFLLIYLSKAKVKTYEAQIGSLTNNSTFTAVAIRQEEVFDSSYAGNVNYYQREGVRVKNGDVVYTVDETGRVSEILSNYTAGDNALSAENLSVIKSTIDDFKIDYSEKNFFKVYDLKSDLNATMLESINQNIMENLDSIIESTGSKNLFQTISTDKSGIVVYSVDGYEDLTTDSISSIDFNKTNYSKDNLKNEALIAKGNPAYKLITSEEWNIVFSVSQTDISLYSLSSKDAITIKFNKDNLIDTFDFKLVTEGEKSFGVVSLNKYAVRYATDRFLDIEIVSAGKSGIKIPVSSVTEQEFYIVPKEYLTAGGNSNSYGFIVEKYDTANQLYTIFVDADVYKVDDEFVYLNTKDFSEGTNIIKTDSSDRFVLGQTKKLKGVYCVNTGYTVFKLVEIIDGNKEYYIVKQGITHGIALYDRVVLEADKFSENEMIY